LRRHCDHQLHVENEWALWWALATDSIAKSFALQEEGLDMLFMRERTEAAFGQLCMDAAVLIGIEAQIL
jgi:hypothetical protein